MSSQPERIRGFHGLALKLEVLDRLRVVLSKQATERARGSFGNYDAMPTISCHSLRQV